MNKSIYFLFLILISLVLVSCEKKSEEELIEEVLIESGYTYDYLSVKKLEDNKVLIFGKGYFQVNQTGYDQVKYYYDEEVFWIQVGEFCSWTPEEENTYNPCSDDQIQYFQEVKIIYMEELENIGLSTKEINQFLNSKNEPDRITS